MSGDRWTDGRNLPQICFISGIGKLLKYYNSLCLTIYIYVVQQGKNRKQMGKSMGKIGKHRTQPKNLEKNRKNIGKNIGKTH